MLQTSLVLALMLPTSSGVQLTGSGFAFPTTHATCIRARRPALAAADSLSDAVSDATEWPEQLMGPWELRTTVSGMSDTWVELGEDGSCSCSSRIGKGRGWSASRKREGWSLSVNIVDKMSRPVTFEGEAREDETRIFAISGMVRGAPLLRASAAERARGVEIGEFRGFKLE
jgi:hypothetical protein